MKFDMVFIFNTGRCGSQSIAKSLDTLSEVEAFHEPTPILIRENLLRWLDKLSGHEYYLPNVSEVLKKARKDKIKETNKKGKIYVESSHFLSMFILDLYKIYPKALFVHLVRDGREVARSGVNKGWYTNTNIADITCTTQGNRWGASGWYAPIYCNSQLTKSCNYWKIQNEIIEKNLEQIPNDQKLFIRLEDNDLKPLCDKLEIDTPKWKVCNSKEGDAPKFKNWSETDKKIGMKLMGELLKKYGYM